MNKAAPTPVRRHWRVYRNSRLSAITYSLDEAEYLASLIYARGNKADVLPVAAGVSREDIAAEEEMGGLDESVDA